MAAGDYEGEMLDEPEYWRRYPDGSVRLPADVTSDHMSMSRYLRMRDSAEGGTRDPKSLCRAVQCSAALTSFNAAL